LLNSNDQSSAPLRGPLFIFLIAFFGLFFLSWPAVLSLDLWVFKDRGSFLNLDNLLGQRLRLGVDTYYSYGLLPVWIQHLLFRAFGAGYGPLLGCTIATIALMALFWALLLRHLPGERIWLLTIVALCPIVIWVNPNFPYSLVQLSMLFALWFVLERRLAAALVVSMVGCLSVPSLTLALSFFLVLLIIVNWWTESDRKVGTLIGQLVPGVLTYLVGAVALASIFSVPSFVASALPLLGMQFYKAVHYGTIGALLEFLHPTGQSVKYLILYYAATPVTWWTIATLLLFYFGLRSAKAVWIEKKIQPKHAVILICTVLQSIFAFHGYGVPGQEIVYSPWLLAAVLVGAAELPNEMLRKRIVMMLAVVGLLGTAAQARRTLLDWQTSVRNADTANLYAHTDWAREWSGVLQLSHEHKLFLFSYGTGQHHYFPTVESPNVWFVRTGQMFPSDKGRVLAQLQGAEIVVEDLGGATSFIDYDPDVQQYLKQMCLTDVSPNFQIWRRASIESASAACKQNLRRKGLE
jgi:hypothetical protein